ncbi:hypothetical protein HAX54_006142, partial [Datura stramonium]|nr:hypothetical protein [Datura stramonium]
MKMRDIKTRKLSKGRGNGRTVYLIEIRMINHRSLSKESRNKLEESLLKKTVCRSRDDKLLDKSQIVKYGAKDGLSFQGM